jgi:hypothetical protein
MLPTPPYFLAPSKPGMSVLMLSLTHSQKSQSNQCLYEYFLHEVFLYRPFTTIFLMLTYCL